MKIIDLTMPIDARTPVYPGDPRPRIWQKSMVGKDGFNTKGLEISSHFGTHVDAPFHILQGGKKLEDFPLSTFIGNAVVLDARKSNERKEIIADTSKADGADFVLFCTGNSKNCHSENYFGNSTSISLQTAKELVAKKVKIVGIDCLSPDNEPFATHRELLGNGVLILENLVNLEGLIGKKFECTIMPLRIADADGAPCRVICLTD
ncbi:MAG: cyclase family protein [Candidatus Diapherotrites archaeon]|uniref:Cyclase family protein n=1 Tax=Candidatus Iainarchaeum sp. TaxID=3101447 RepID=A0A8T3YIX3_9ARCH|nr:cyclase family protein [Candidatus Diapherotrites archaeon]